MDLSQLNDTSQNAIDAHKASQLDTAEKIYNDILIHIYPDHPNANHSLRILYNNLGRFQEALFRLRKAILANPNVEQFWVSLMNTEAHLEYMQS